MGMNVLTHHPVHMTAKKQFSLILILGALSAISPFSTDLYCLAFRRSQKIWKPLFRVPAIPLTSCFVGIAAGQLLYQLFDSER